MTKIWSNLENKEQVRQEREEREGRGGRKKREWFLSIIMFKEIECSRMYNNVNNTARTIYNAVI